MKNIDKVVLTEDITDEVALDGGNPTKESIMGIFVNYARDYLNDMGLIMIFEDADYVTVVEDSFIKEESWWYGKVFIGPYVDAVNNPNDSCTY